MARCPAHDDSRASLSVAAGKDQPVVFHCHAGCHPDEIVAKLGLNWATLMAPQDGHGVNTRTTGEWTPAGTATAVYDYTDETGHLLFQVLRTADKQFRQRVPNPKAKSGWTWKLGEVRRVLYRLPDLIQAVEQGREIWICEGEKDVHSLIHEGIAATCNPGGAGKWREEYAATLAGAAVTIVADTDDPGRAHATTIRDALHGVAASLRIVEAAQGKDITDHIRAGRPLDGVTISWPPGDGVAPDAPLPARHVVLTAADTMTMKAPRWLYDRRIPAGAITLLAGREGIGKSTIGFDIAARVTRGELRGTRWGKPAGVAVVATEDQWAEVILPRLVAAHADLTRVYQVEAITPTGDIETIVAPTDLALLRLAVADRDIALLVLDPIMSVVSAELDTHKDRELRKALEPLARFAADTVCAILGLIHANKSATTDPLNSIMGSKAFTAVTRSVLYCIADPETTDETERYLFCHPKSNLGPKQPSIGYTIQEAGILLSEATGETIPTSCVRWGEEDRRTAADVMDAPRDRAAGELATSILDWMRAPERVLPVVTAAIVAAFPEEKPATVRKNLTRMAARGTLTNPIHGHYALPARVVTGDCDSLAIPSYLSQVSKVSLPHDHKDGCDGSDAVTGTGPPVTTPVTTAGQHYAPCAACGTPAPLESDDLCFDCWKTGKPPQPGEPEAP
jgi:hypothetical protein